MWPIKAKIKEQREKETGAYSKGRNNGLIIAGSIINNKEVLPSADVVEVVRCGECQWYDNDECQNPRIHMSDSAHLYTDKADFCSYGERRTDNDTL